MAALPGITVALGNPPSSDHQMSQLELADWMTEFEALAGSSGLSYIDGTLASLEARVGTVDGEYGLVLNDTVEGGVYERIAGVWTKKAEVPAIFTKLQQAQLDEKASKDSLYKSVGLPISPAYMEIGFNSLFAEWLFHGLENEVINYGLADGSLGLGPVLIERSENNSLGAMYFIRGADGSTPFYGDGFSAHLFGNSFEIIQENEQDYVAVLRNSVDNKVLGAWDQRGSFDHLSERHVIYEAAGDIYELRGTVPVRLTFTGDNFAPREEGFGWVRFASTRMGDTREYRVHRANPGYDFVIYDTQAPTRVIMGSGQSLWQGGANAAVSTTALNPGRVRMLTSRPIGSADQVLALPLVDLKEDGNETYATAITDTILVLDEAHEDIVFFGQGTGGAQIENLSKGGSTGDYEAVLSYLSSVHGALAANGGVFVPACFFVQGRADGLDSDPNYADDLRAYLDDVQADVLAVTGQSYLPHLIISQVGSAAFYDPLSTRDNFTTPFAEYDAAEAHLDIHIAMPEYWLTYRNAGNDSHPDLDGMHEQGTVLGAKYYDLVVRGRTDLVVKPVSFDLAGTNLTITFQVPGAVPHIPASLVFDTAVVSDPGDYGFSARGPNGLSVTGVSISGTDKVVVQFNQAPVAGQDSVSYAFHNGTDGYSGRALGARGNLRSDRSVAISKRTETSVRDWCLIFKHDF